MAAPSLTLPFTFGASQFKKADPAHFGGLGHALLTLFRAATMEDWSDLMYIAMLGCGEYGYPALDVSGWVPGMPARQDAITAFCQAAPLGPRIENATLLCGSDGIVPLGGLATDITANNRACFPDWPTYFDAAKNNSWIIFLGSTDSTPIAPLYYIFFILVAGIVMLSLFIGAVTLGMQQAMDETTESKRRALHEKLKSAARTSQSTLMQNESTANKVARMWMGQEVLEEEVEHAVVKQLLFKETPVLFVLTKAIFRPADHISNHPWFTKAITGVIVVAAVMVGFDFTQTQPIDLSAWVDCRSQCMGAVTGFAEYAINVIFTIEVVVKLLACAFKPWRYFLNGWNVFDFIIVALAWSPGGGEFVVVLRLLRLLRVLKLVRALPQLQVIVLALIKGLSSIGYIAMLLFLIYYIYAIVGMLLFQNNDPWHFGSLHITMFTLFRCSTLEDWTDVMYINMVCVQPETRVSPPLDIRCTVASERLLLTHARPFLQYGCDVYGYRNNYMLEAECKHPEVKFSTMVTSVLFFTTFVVLTNLVTLSLFIGVVTTSMQEAADTQTEEKRKKRQLQQLEAKYHISHERVIEFQKIFNVFDWSGDRVIDRQEFSFAIRCLNKEATENQISDWMLLGDEKCTGEIDFLAFCQVLMTLDASKKKAAANPAREAVDPAQRSSRAKAVLAAGAEGSNNMLNALEAECVEIFAEREKSFALLRMSSLEVLANRRREQGRRAALFEDEEAKRVPSPGWQKRQSPKIARSLDGPQHGHGVQSDAPPNICGEPFSKEMPGNSGGGSVGGNCCRGPGVAVVAPSAPSKGRCSPSVKESLRKSSSPEGISGGLSVLRRVGRKTIATRKLAQAPLAALALGEATVPPEMEEVVKQCNEAKLIGLNLELILLKLGRLKGALQVRLQRSRASDGAEPSATTIFCEALRGHLDDLEASLYIQLKPKLIGTDDDGNGQLVLGGHVVAQVVHKKPAPRTSAGEVLKASVTGSANEQTTRRASTCGKLMASGLHRIVGKPRSRVDSSVTDTGHGNENESPPLASPSVDPSTTELAVEKLIRERRLLDA